MQGAEAGARVRHAGDARTLTGMATVAAAVAATAANAATANATAAGLAWSDATTAQAWGETRTHQPPYAREASMRNDDSKDGNIKNQVYCKRLHRDEW
jgi:hypothetical protein